MNRFRELRINNDYSQTQLANKLKVHQTAISQWELGKSFPDILTMQKLADLYGVSIDYILGRETSRNGQATLSEDEKKLLRNYRGLGAEEKNTVQDFIENKKQKPRMYEISAAASGGGSVTKQLTEEEVEAIRKILNQIDQG
jgi:transcriptional regulator with XRE-family HTH domain